MNIKINKSCPEKWENMQDSPEGKFCEKCSKCVIDFTDKSAQEITKILNEHEKDNVCGRIFSGTSFKASSLAASIILTTNITFINAQTFNQSHNNKSGITALKKENQTINFSGTLLNSKNKQPIINAEVYFIQLKKYLKAITDEKGNFSIEIPYETINDENVIYINFQNLISSRKSKDTAIIAVENNKLILSKTDLLRKKTYEFSTDRYTEIGAVVIVTPEPPNYYYFNGKTVSKRKFEKLRKENLQYQYLRFEGCPHGCPRHGQSCRRLLTSIRFKVPALKTTTAWQSLRGSGLGLNPLTVVPPRRSSDAPHMSPWASRARRENRFPKHSAPDQRRR